MLRRALILAGCARALLAPAAAHATGVFEKAGPTMIYTAAAGDIDQIAAFETPTTIRFTRFGGASFGPGPGCNFLQNDSNTIDCVKDGVTSVVLDLGDGDDVASINPSLKIPVIFNGADGRDGLFGGGGTDVFDGGAGDDNIISRDARGRAGQLRRRTRHRDLRRRRHARLLRGGPGRRRPRRRALSPPTATTPTRASTRAPSTSPTTASTRTARGSTPSISTATATASRARRTAMTPTPRSARARPR